VSNQDYLILKWIDIYYYNTSNLICCCWYGYHMLIDNMGAYKTINGIHIIYRSTNNCVGSNVYCTIHLFTYQFIVKQIFFKGFVNFHILKILTSCLELEAMCNVIIVNNYIMNNDFCFFLYCMIYKNMTSNVKT
jgi:hypothetical protein